MDGSRFAAWTRRRVSLATGGLLAPLLGVGISASVEAKKCKGKKKKCKGKCSGPCLG